MKNINIDKDQIIKYEPEYRIWGVVVENEKHGKRLILGAKLSIICGVIGIVTLAMMLSFYLN